MTEWRPVVGYEGLYEVSNTGRVRSLDRRVNSRWNGTRLISGRELTFYVTYDGYLTFTLYEGACRKKNIKVSRLVASAFLAKVEGKDLVLHNDGDPANNHVSNLRWGTPKENMEDRKKHGNDHYAERDSCSAGHKYTPETVRYRAAANGEMTQRRCLVCDRNYRKRVKG